MALAISGTVSGVFAERIRFSKPAVPIAAPPKVQEELPALQGKRLEFTAPNSQPFVAPPAVVRVAPVRPKDREEDRTHWLLRDPKNSPDATGRANPLDNPLSGRARDSLGGEKKPDKNRPSHSLSPITNPENSLRDNRDARDRDGRDNDWFDDIKSRREQTGLTRNSRLAEKNSFYNYDSAKEKENNTEARSSFFADIFAPRPKEKLTPAQVGRREDFERLINPIPNGIPNPMEADADVNFNPNGNGVAASGRRVPGSLQPVLEPPRAATVSPAPAEKSQARPADSLQAFKQQQAKLRGPILEDPTKKYETPQEPVAASFLDPNARPSLMRQPTLHDIPARKF